MMRGAPEASPGRRDPLRLALRELERVRDWCDRRGERLDRVLADLGSPPLPSRRRDAPGADPLRPATSVVAGATASGALRVAVNGGRPFLLPPLLGELFVALAADGGHAVDDGLVGFKSNAFLIARLSRGRHTGRRAMVNRRYLARACYELREQLALHVPGGQDLVQTRRGLGRRVLVSAGGTDGT